MIRVDLIYGLGAISGEMRAASPMPHSRMPIYSSASPFALSRLIVTLRTHFAESPIQSGRRHFRAYPYHVYTRLAFATLRLRADYCRFKFDDIFSLSRQQALRRYISGWRRYLLALLALAVIGFSRH